MKNVNGISALLLILAMLGCMYCAPDRDSSWGIWFLIEALLLAGAIIFQTNGRRWYLKIKRRLRNGKAETRL